MTIDSWKKNLIKGYQSFRSGAYKKHKKLYEKLGTVGQNPEVFVVSCCDSRVNPAAVFDAYPGEIFEVQNVANIVPPYDPRAGYHGTSSALEYAVTVLKVKAIVVMGHESCGGVKAFLDSREDNVTDSLEHSFIGSWIHILDAAHGQLCKDDPKNAYDQRQMEYAGVRQSLINLMSFPFVEKAVNAGELSLQGAYFSIIQGKLLFANKDGIFEEVPTNAA